MDLFYIYFYNNDFMILTFILEIYKLNTYCDHLFFIKIYLSNLSALLLLNVEIR